MKGSVIKRMYAGFALIIIMFAITITIMMNSMNQIHKNLLIVKAMPDRKNKARLAPKKAK